MSLSPRSIDNFIDKVVQSGSCSSKAEAEKQLREELQEREIDRKIAKGRADIKAGRYTVVNKETTSAFVAKLAKKILPKSE